MQYMSPDVHAIARLTSIHPCVGQYTIGGITNILCVLDTTPESISDCSGPACVEVDLRCANGTGQPVGGLAWGPDGAGGSLDVSNATSVAGNDQGGVYAGLVNPFSTVDLTDDDSDFDLARDPGVAFSLRFNFSAGGETAMIQCDFEAGDGDGAVREAHIAS